MVQCVLLGKEAPGLDKPPYGGELGKRIYENVSKEAWQMWVPPVEPAHRKRLEFEMEKFFFGGGSDKPKEFVQPG